MTPGFDEADLRRALGPVRLDATELAALGEAMLLPHRPAIRLNTLGRAVTREAVPFAAEPVPWFSGPAYRAAAGVRPAGHPFFAAGAYYVQDAGSLLPVTLLDPRPGEVVCDLCASPGGKATAILERLGGAGWLLVNESIRSRLPPLLLNLARHGSTRWAMSCLDPERLADAVGPVFDAVLVDAPCTAQSLVGRGKQTRRAFDPELIEHSAIRQSRILNAAVRLLRPGGRLVYSTCTFAWHENEGQVAGLLTRFSQLRADAVGSLAEYQSGDASSASCYRLWPHRHDCAGGFAARFVASEAIGEWRSGGALRRRDGREHGANAFGGLPGEWGRWLEAPSMDVRRERVFGWPGDLPAEIRAIAEAGPEAAYRKGQTWFPAHALAMRRDGMFEPRARVEIEGELVRRFLAGEGVRGKEVGWVVVAYQGLVLGWVKGNGNVLQNHLPKPARVVIDGPRASSA